MRRALFVFAMSLAVPALAGCENEQPRTALNYSADAKKAYDAAMEDFNSHAWIDAQNGFREVKRKFAYSRYARLAELRIADIDFAQDKYAEAVRGYRQFIHDHRSDEEDVAYARARIAEAEYAQVPESILLPAPEERDQATMMDAYKELRGFLHDYPDAKESAHIKELLADVTAKLVKHELAVARFYLGKDNFDAAVGRILYALNNFSAAATAQDPQGGPAVDSGLEPEALLLLGQTYLKMHKYLAAKQSFLVILQRYPKSELTTPAKGYLQFLHLQGA